MPSIDTVLRLPAYWPPLLRVSLCMRGLAKRPLVSQFALGMAFARHSRRQVFVAMDLGSMTLALLQAGLISANMGISVCITFGVRALALFR